MGQFWQVEYVNPVNVYCEFKAGGDNKEILGKIFTYDKEAGANIPFELWECIVLKTGYTINGYSDKHSTGIYSNTVEYLNEELEVKTHKSKVTGKSETIAYGLYKEIKGDVVASGARLNKVLYLLTDDSRIVYLSLKWEASRSVSEWLKNYNQSKVKIKLSSTEEKKKGATKYLVPIRWVGSEITEDEAEIAMSKLALLNANSPKKEDKPSLVDELLNEVDQPTESEADFDIPF